METLEITASDGTTYTLKDGHIYKFHLKHLTRLEDGKETVILSSDNRDDTHFAILMFKDDKLNLLASSMTTKDGHKMSMDTDDITIIKDIQREDLPLYMEYNTTHFFTEILKKS